MRRGDDEELAASLEAADSAVDRARVGRGGEDDVSAAELLEPFGRTDLLRVDVVVCAELASELFLVRPLEMATT